MNATPLRIRLYGDPCLRKKSAPIVSIGVAEQSLIQAMLIVMRENKGVGLAAPQVGINRQVFIADIGDGPFAFINPKITRRFGHSSMEEGCLSIPGIVVTVRRSEKIVVRYIDQDNRPQEKVYEDMMARVIQHEIDHLQGKMIVDYASLKERIEMHKQLKELERQFKGKGYGTPSGR